MTMYFPPLMSLDMLFPEQIRAIYMSPHSLLSTAQVNQGIQPDYPSQSKEPAEKHQHHSSLSPG